MRVQYAKKQGRVLLPFTGEGGMRSMTDEGPCGLVRTSRQPSSDPCFARATFSHEWEKEGALLSLDFGDRRTDRVERDVSAADHQFVAKPEDAIAMFAQPGVARSVVSFLLVAIMRRAVEFDRETMLHAEEIHDIAADGNLPAEFQPVEPAAAQRPPEHRLGLRHVAAKFAGEGGAVF